MTLKRKKEEELLSNCQCGYMENSLIHSFIHTNQQTWNIGHVQSAVVF